MNDSQMPLDPYVRPARAVPLWGSIANILGLIGIAALGYYIVPQLEMPTIAETHTVTPQVVNPVPVVAGTSTQMESSPESDDVSEEESATSTPE